MATEPRVKRTIAFFDGQNLFHAAREAFGNKHPNYGPLELANSICVLKGWDLVQTRFYTGIPDPADAPFWHDYWSRRLQALSRKGVVVYSRPLRYRNKIVRLPDGSEHTFAAGEEKGIDVRIALDLIQLATHDEYDVGLIFSQDRDLSEVADETRSLARESDRWIKLASAFPSGPVSRNRRGINKTDWIPIDRELYQRCVDPYDYRAPDRRRP
ncbi:MAG: NYN domain-containing protein [Candidatus Eisenbacteria bacterium]|nr:NYN domain-containing protein [Candidatus Eisenbacteria bacterium]